jgi:lysozyme family protein
MLQQAIGTDIDGEIGPLTLAAVAAQPFAQTLATYAEIRRERYRGLAQFWRFGRGWLARIDRTLELADAIARAMPATVSPQQQEPKPMPADTPATTQPAPASDSKWWGQSMTIWGVIITTLSTVLPALSPVIGINVTADLIQQLGDSLVLFGQAAAALIGTVMTVYGRFRASTPLERRQLTLKM